MLIKALDHCIHIQHRGQGAAHLVEDGQFLSADLRLLEQPGVFYSHSGLAGESGRQSGVISGEVA